MGKGMKAGKKPNPNKGMGGNMQKQMAQMQAMQRKMEELQEEIDKKEVTATSGGGAVSVTVNGTKQIVSMQIKEEAVDPDDVEMLQDLIVAAVNEGLEEVERVSQERLGKYTSNLSL